VPDEPSTPERVRAAELVGALCLATDVAMGFPFEHGLHATQVAMRLADRLGIDAKAASDTANVARDASFQQLLGGVERAARVVGERAGAAFDPEVAACLVDNANELLVLDPSPSAWEDTLACEPSRTPRRWRDVVPSAEVRRRECEGASLPVGSLRGDRDVAGTAAGLRRGVEERVDVGLRDGNLP
jgi:hypothetical protein